MILAVPPLVTLWRGPQQKYPFWRSTEQVKLLFVLSGRGCPKKGKVLEEYVIDFSGDPKKIVRVKEDLRRCGQDFPERLKAGGWSEPDKEI